MIMLVSRLPFMSWCYYYDISWNEGSSYSIPKYKNDKHHFSSFAHSHKIIFYNNKYHFRPF